MYKYCKTKAQWLDHFRDIKYFKFADLVEEGYKDVPDDSSIKPLEIANFLMMHERFFSFSTITYIVWGVTDISEEVEW